MHENPIIPVVFRVWKGAGAVIALFSAFRAGYGYYRINWRNYNFREVA